MRQMRLFLNQGFPIQNEEEVVITVPLGLVQTLDDLLIRDVFARAVIDNE